MRGKESRFTKVDSRFTEESRFQYLALDGVDALLAFLDLALDGVHALLAFLDLALPLLDLLLHGVPVRKTGRPCAVFGV